MTQCSNAFDNEVALPRLHSPAKDTLSVAKTGKHQGSAAALLGSSIEHNTGWQKCCSVWLTQLLALLLILLLLHCKRLPLPIHQFELCCECSIG